MKTLQGWQASQQELTSYLNPGDEVEEAFTDWALNVMPPAFWSNRIIQVGEPNSHINGIPTFATFYRDAGIWHFGGYCHRGRISSPLPN